jgi:hypothetical protein
MSIERNAPCPCGSGRKYKKCCLAAEEDARAEEERALAPLRGVLAALGAESQRAWPSQAIERAELAFFGFDDILQARVGEDEMELMTYYMLFDHVPEPRDAPDWVDGETLADMLLRRPDNRLSPSERTTLSNVRASIPSIYTVVAVEPRANVRMRDVFRGHEVEILDAGLARDAAEGEVHYLRLVPDGERFRIIAAGSVTWPASWADAFHAFRDDFVAQRPDGLCSDELLRSNADQLRFHYLDVAYDDGPWEEQAEGRSRSLELEFEVLSARHAFDALCYLAGDPERAEMDVRRDENDEVITAAWPWLDLDDDARRWQDVPVVGAFSAEGTRLLVEVADATWADCARRLVADVMPMAREVAVRAVGAGAINSAATGDRIAGGTPGSAARFWETWLTSPARSLDERTPLDAVALPGGRERVASYLAEVEDALPRMGLPRHDTAALRSRLGLPPREC